MYMTIEEVAKKLNSLLMESSVRKDLLVADTTVVREGPGALCHTYAPGTVIFDCIDSATPDRYYRVWVDPDKVSKYMN